MFAVIYLVFERWRPALINFLGCSAQGIEVASHWHRGRVKTVNRSNYARDSLAGEQIDCDVAMLVIGAVSV